MCGGIGNSYLCKIQILTGSVSEPTASEKEDFSSEELEEGYRRACQIYPQTDCKLRGPDRLDNRVFEFVLRSANQEIANGDYRVADFLLRVTNFVLDLYPK